MKRARVAVAFLVAFAATLSVSTMTARAADAPAPATVTIAIEATAPGLATRLHGVDDGRPDYNCDSACVLQVVPGRYRLDVADARDHWTLQTLDLAHAETVEVRASNHGAAVAGGILAGAGLLVAAAGAGTTIYYAVNALEESDCPTPCGPKLSRNVLRAGVIGLGAGALLGIAGGIVFFSNADPSAVERPSLASFLSPRPGRFALALLPVPGTRAPYAIATLTF